MTEKEAIQMLERMIDPDPWEDDGLSDKAKQALQMGIDALEKQIPKKPVEGYVFREKFREYLAKIGKKDMAESKGSCCPSCGEHIGESEAILKKKNYMPFCKWCGQAFEQPESET